MQRLLLVAVIALTCIFTQIDLVPYNDTGNVMAYTDHGDAPGYPDAIHTFGYVANRLGPQMSVDDGITFPATLPVNFTISYSIQAVFGPPQGYLDAWIDWNQDLDWDDSGEHVYGLMDFTVESGNGSFNGTIPAGVLAGTTWMRVRLAVEPNDSPTATLTTGGEVEDYQVTHVEGPPVPEPTTIALLGIGLAGIMGYCKKVRKKKANQ